MGAVIKIENGKIVHVDIVGEQHLIFGNLEGDMRDVIVFIVIMSVILIVSALLTKLIVTSDLPTWVKIWLLK